MHPAPRQSHYLRRRWSGRRDSHWWQSSGGISLWRLSSSMFRRSLRRSQHPVSCPNATPLIYRSNRPACFVCLRHTQALSSPSSTLRWFWQSRWQKIRSPLGLRYNSDTFRPRLLPYRLHFGRNSEASWPPVQCLRPCTQCGVPHFPNATGRSPALP